ncbi:alanine/glycine:cation symporter family protein [Micavibrio aeruginosavorus]|uniref:Amino acid carrier family protein n=1 Tax=Micavibrio aeruginosavorus (strain ARL-13) TaxID=856793 RepID=G2KPF6_MICAA|nr:amino acid carrier protein [Micavibrio aeruginosavorus]AEP09456.1 amino acid carrier family protein [Micavibrio aeruginosavorus ARL-13]
MTAHAPSGIDKMIDSAFVGLADFFDKTLFYGLKFDLPGAAGEMVTKEAPLILIWLVMAGVIFTLYFRFVNLRLFKHSFDVVSGKFEEPGAPGQTTNFQALMASLAGTVGLGNIAGVAVAVSVGGPGAVFWMVVMGFIGMSTKFIEVAAGVKYRRVFINEEGKTDISGGPMYYLQDIFSARGLPAVGKFLAIVFAIFCIGGSLGGGNMFQANQTFIQFVNATGGPEASVLAGQGWLFGLGLAILTGIVIIGGIRSIANVSARLVPMMALLYVIAGLFVILMNYQHIPAALWSIIHDAFTPAAGLGAVVGGLLIGVQRASFSNEAGLGSASIIQSTARTNEPIRQGLAGMMGPFLDTIVICSVTALVITISGVYEGGQGMQGITLTAKAFSTAIPFADHFLALCVFLFAFSTMIGWGYLGVKASTFIFGEHILVENAFKLIFCGFIIIGCASDLSNVIRFTDSLILSMAIPNIIGLYIMAPEIKKDLQAYLAAGKHRRVKGEGVVQAAE